MSNGKGRAPEKGYNRAAYRTNYDAIFRQQLKTMKTNQPGLGPTCITPRPVRGGKGTK